MLTEFATATTSKTKGIQWLHEIPSLTAEKQALGWTEAWLKGILRGNCLRLLDRVWHGA